MNSIQDSISNHRVWYCLDCGKCASVCPITRWETRAYASPRLLIERAVLGQAETLPDDPLFWSCLTCQRCTALCPSDVHFSEFLRDVRSLAREEQRCADCTHSEMPQTLGRMMADPDLKQNRLGWLRDDLQISEESDTLYFVGCLPYYDAMFKELGAEGIEIAQGTLKILNHLGIQPQVLADERCCGHDQLWQGDIDTFQGLAQLNLETLQASGAKRIVTTCPECARTLRLDYPQLVGEHGMEVMHLTELLVAEGLEVPRLPAAAGASVTYQDPCRLGRHLGVYDAPRQVMSELGFELTEMGKHAQSSQCCGTTCWSSCGQVSKTIQVERLGEARATGAKLLVTACQKCQIHFKCAQHDPQLGEELSLPIRDLTTLIADALCQQPEEVERQEVYVGD